MFSKACNEFEAKEANLEIYDKIIKLRVVEEKAMLTLRNEEDLKHTVSDDIKFESNVMEKEIDESESCIRAFYIKSVNLCPKLNFFFVFINGTPKRFLGNIIMILLSIHQKMFNLVIFYS